MHRSLFFNKDACLQRFRRGKAFSSEFSKVFENSFFAEHPGRLAMEKGFDFQGSVKIKRKEQPQIS